MVFPCQGRVQSVLPRCLSTFVMSVFAASAMFLGITAGTSVPDAGAVGPTCAPDTGNLLAYWKLDEGAGTLSADSTGNGHDGTLLGGTWTSATAPTAFDNPYAVEFDGTDDEITSADTLLQLGTQDFTVSLFAKAGPAAGNRSVMGHYDNLGAGHRGWGLYFYSINRVNFFGYGTMGTNDTSHAATVLDDVWHHVAGVYSRSGDSLTIDVYVDGVWVGSNTTIVGDISIVTPMRLGRYTFQPFFAGSLDDVRVYDGALSAEQIGYLAGGNCGYFCHDKVPTILGSDANEILLGTSGNDVIMSLGGMDVVHGKGGNDTICTGDGNDIAKGDGGNDWIDAGDGGDALYGDAGMDTMYGGGDNDALLGGSGSPDTLDGGGGTDACIGEAETACEV